MGFFSMMDDKFVPAMSFIFEFLLQL